MTPDGAGIPCHYIFLPSCGNASLASAVASVLTGSYMAVKLRVPSVVNFTHDSVCMTCLTGPFHIIPQIWYDIGTIWCCENCFHCRRLLQKVLQKGPFVAQL